MVVVKPKLSVLVIGYRMSRQLANTLYTLSDQFQRGVSESQYEVVIVENSSDDNLDPSFLSSLGDNFRYFRRQENSCTPVPAINFGFSKCRGQVVGLLIDGARMLTPGVLRYALMAECLSENSITAVPGYQLGPKPQHISVLEGYNETVEQSLLSSVDWRSDGYELFSISSISGANPNGYLQPMMECNCIFAPAKSFESIGFADERFNLRGGGAINLHIYRSLGMMPNSQLVVLPGEGSFHQFHGGVTTSSYEGLERENHHHREQLQAIWKNEFHSLRKEPLLLGTISEQAQKFLQFSSEMARKRFCRLRKQGLPFWADELTKVS